MKNYEILDFGDFEIYISLINGNTYTNYEKNQSKDELDNVFDSHEFFEKDKKLEFDKKLFKTVYISLQITDKCNLNCQYCFVDKRKNKSLDYQECIDFIDKIIEEYPNAEKYIVDPTGSGEPLLNEDVLYKIGEYCFKKSDEIRKEVLPMIVTNGTLLTSERVKKLQDSGILFGVSLDGNKKQHNSLRVDYSGKGTYKNIIDNIKEIKDKSLMGAAVTLTGNNTDLVKLVKHLSRYFPTISIKPVRSSNPKLGINVENIKEIKASYVKLFEFLLSETKKGNIRYLMSLINGDDYFGKFLIRTVLDERILSRCDAGIGRFSLSIDKNIYACPGATGLKEMQIGDVKGGINEEKVSELWKVLTERQKCNDCFAKYVCGGVCLVNSVYTGNGLKGIDLVMCELNKHLYKLSLLFKELLLRNGLLSLVKSACLEKINRFEKDENLQLVLQNTNEYSFNQLKDFKFNKQSKFTEILKKYKE